MPTDCLHIYRAPWVVPVEGDVLADGAVVVDGRSIVDVADYADISVRYPDTVTTQCAGVLLPALVNAHIHLDLSVVGTVYPDTGASSMCDWIGSLLCLREEKKYSVAEVEAAANKTIGEQYESGVGLMLNICNSPLQYDRHEGIKVISLLEMLGPSEIAQDSVIQTLDQLANDICVTAHAPYSTGPRLLAHIKKRSVKHNSLFSLHLAENTDEYHLLSDGTGCFGEFLDSRGLADGTYPIPGFDSERVVGYLNRLGVIDETSLFVHCVHLDEKEILLIAQAKGHICLCPQSNHFLDVGTAPVDTILSAGIIPALGTDSIASNPMLDIWNEMSTLSHDHPDVDAAVILQMATIGGARALHESTIYGRLVPGGIANFICIQAEAYKDAKSGKELIKKITSYGRPDSISWMGPAVTC